MTSSALKSRAFLSRRALLRGAGVTLALPFLESLTPRSLMAQAAAPPVRLLYWFIPNGVIYDRWIPKAVGMMDAAAVPESIQPFADAGVLGDINILSGVDNLPGIPESVGDHASGLAAMMTCAKAKKVVTGVELGISADQVAAATLGTLTARPSLEIGMARSGTTGDCDSGYSCSYAQTMSWTDKTTPRPKRTDPKDAWMWLIGTDNATLTAEQREKMRKGDKSVLDYLIADAGSLAPKLTSDDRAKLDQYLTSVRSLEMQLNSAAVSPECLASVPPENSNDYITRLGRMMDVMEFAFKCDLTRVVTFAFGNAFGPGPMPWINISDDYHALTHRMNEAGVTEQVAQCILWETQQIAAFVKRLKEVPEGTQNLLYNTAFFVSSDIGQGGPHNHDNMPVLVAGNAGGKIATGRHLAYTPEDPSARRKGRTEAAILEASAIPNTNKLANVHLSLLQAAGVPATSFGNSTGPIAGLVS
jgi:hypothetical protein